MIICKIMADYSGQGDFNRLFDKLSGLGSVHFRNKVLFFGSDHETVDRKKVSKVMRACGYHDFAIVVYNAKNPPTEDQVDNGWILDWQARLTKIAFEKDNQEKMRAAMETLDKIEKQLDETAAKEKEGVGSEQN